MNKYPEAKVILSVRDSPRAWVKSASRTIIKINQIGLHPPTKYMMRKTQHIWTEYLAWKMHLPFPREDVLEATYSRYLSTQLVILHLHGQHQPK
jgi:hypothetical protein